MNDDFLKQYRKEPDQAYIEAVYRKISMGKSKVSTMKRLVFALVFLLAVLGFTLSVSPRARGAALELIREVGGLRFIETIDYPGEDEKTEIVDRTDVPLEDAMHIFPGTISLPTILPDDYRLEPSVKLFDPKGGSEGLPTAFVTWRKSNSGGGWSSVSLVIIYLADEKVNYSFVVGEGAIEEITINGKPAAFLRGGWNYDTKSYDTGIHMQSIHWNYDEHTIYELSSDKSVGLEMLIRIAESIK